MGAAVWAPPIGRRCLGAHRLGDGTYGRRDKWAPLFGRWMFRRWTTKPCMIQCTAAVITPDRPCNRGHIADEQGSGLKEGVSARRRLTA